MSNRNIWIMVGVIALAILALIVMDFNQKPGRIITNSMSDVIDSPDAAVKEDGNDKTDAGKK